MNLYLPLILFCFSTLITPGPNNIMIMISGVNFGIKKSLPHYFGICLGFSVMVLAVGLGLREIFIKYPYLHAVIKYVGAIYMLYLAWKIINSSFETNSNNKSKRKPFTFMQASLFQWINPKAWVVAIGALSTYTNTNRDVFNQVIIMSTMFFVIGLLCMGSWLISGLVLKSYLTNQIWLRRFNISMGILLILSIALVLI